MTREAEPPGTPAEDAEVLFITHAAKVSTFVQVFFVFLFKIFCSPRPAKPRNPSHNPCAPRSGYSSADHGLHVCFSVEVVLNLVRVSRVAAGERGGRGGISAGGRKEKRGRIGSEPQLASTPKKKTGAGHSRPASPCFLPHPCVCGGVFLVKTGRCPPPPAPPLCGPFDQPPAGLHLDVQAPFHAAHLHVLVEVAVHVALGGGQFQLGGGVKGKGVNQDPLPLRKGLCQTVLGPRQS